MPQKLLRPIKLVEANIDAIEQIRANGPCDMFDRYCVIGALLAAGHVTAAKWVMDNPNCYAQMVKAFYEEALTEAEQDTDSKLSLESTTE